MRLFLAIELPAEVREHLARVQQAIAPALDRASITRDAAMHITVKFLGETDPAKLDEIGESLATMTGGPMELMATHAECFPDRGTVRIVAAGFGGDLKRLNGVHDAIEQRCVRLGFRREDRPYRPHVTLARARPILPPAMRRSVTDLTAPLWPGPTLIVEGFALVQTRLTHQGSQYTKLQQFTFKG